MRPARNASPLIAIKDDPENRKHGRFRCGDLVCHLKEKFRVKVLDFSGSGMRLVSPTKLDLEQGAVIPLVMESPMGLLRTHVRIIWLKKRGFRRHEMGVSFADTTPSTRSKLAEIASATSDSDTVYRKVG